MGIVAFVSEDGKELKITDMRMEAWLLPAPVGPFWERYWAQARWAMTGGPLACLLAWRYKTWWSQPLGTAEKPAEGWYEERRNAMSQQMDFALSDASSFAMTT